MVSIGCKIVNKKTKAIHFVESIDKYDDITLVFTCDNKYIPIEDVEVIPHSSIAFFFIKVICGEKIEPCFELNSLNKLKKLKLITFNYYDKKMIKRDLEKYKKRITKSDSQLL